MCGIIGYTGKDQAAAIVYEGLKRLEYRGYDSAGIATVDNNSIHIVKDKGQLGNIAGECNQASLPGTAGIGHVRWATHGGATKKNAHPHCDGNQQIAVVHNGIIANYEELKSGLLADCSFRSETDTEVIPHIIRHYMDAGLCFEDAFFAMTKELKGTYAILALYGGEPGKILAARKDAPLVIGLGEGANFIGSDVLSFLPYAKRVIYLDDGECAVLDKESVKIYDADHNEITKKIDMVNWQWEEGNKGSYEYFMMKEIQDQPRAIRQALLQDNKVIMKMAMSLIRARQVVFVACGTSRHAALIGRYAFSKVGHIFSDVIMGSEFGYFSDSIEKGTIVIAISQSGETADVLSGVREAKANGATIYSLVNVVGSSLARLSDQVLYLNCGPEISVAATKSFTAQLCILYQLAFALDHRLEEGQSKIREISLVVESDLRRYAESLPALAYKLKGKTDFYYLARGVNFAVADEGALKLKEIAYVHAEGMPSGELKHGTLALISDGTPVFAICPLDYTYEDSMANLMEAKARGAHVIGVANSNSMIFDDTIKISTSEEILYPLVTTIPLQMFAYYSAIARGFNPDKPRNLAKSVTVK
jgi:glucosamine--fructose-6-phosphate aminotransferase (isomerizing)